MSTPTITDLRNLLNQSTLSDDIRKQIDNLSDEQIEEAINQFNIEINKIIKAFVEFGYYAQETIKQAIKDKEIDIDWGKLSFENNSKI